MIGKEILVQKGKTGWKQIWSVNGGGVPCELGEN